MNVAFRLLRILRLRVWLILLYVLSWKSQKLQSEKQQISHDLEKHMTDAASLSRDKKQLSQEATDLTNKLKEIESTMASLTTEKSVAMEK